MVCMQPRFHAHRVSRGPMIQPIIMRWQFLLPGKCIAVIYIRAQA